MAASSRPKDRRGATGLRVFDVTASPLSPARPPMPLPALPDGTTARRSSPKLDNAAGRSNRSSATSRVQPAGHPVECVGAGRPDWSSRPRRRSTRSPHGSTTTRLYIPAGTRPPRRHGFLRPCDRRRWRITIAVLPTTLARPAASGPRRDISLTRPGTASSSAGAHGQPLVDRGILEAFRLKDPPPAGLLHRGHASRPARRASPDVVSTSREPAGLALHWPGAPLPLHGLELRRPASRLLTRPGPSLVTGQPSPGRLGPQLAGSRALVYLDWRSGRSSSCRSTLWFAPRRHGQRRPGRLQHQYESVLRSPSSSASAPPASCSPTAQRGQAAALPRPGPRMWRLPASASSRTAMPPTRPRC